MKTDYINPVTLYQITRILEEVEICSRRIPAVQFTKRAINAEQVRLCRRIVPLASDSSPVFWTSQVMPNLDLSPEPNLSLHKIEQRA